MDPILIRSNLEGAVLSDVEGSVYDPYSFPEAAPSSPTHVPWGPADATLQRICADNDPERPSWAQRDDPVPSGTSQAPCMRQLEWEWVLGIRTNPDFVGMYNRGAFIDALTQYVGRLVDTVGGRRASTTMSTPILPASAATPDGIETAFRRSFRCWTDMVTGEIKSLLDWMSTVERSERELALETHASLDGVEHVANHFLLRADALPPRAREAAVAQVARRRAWIHEKITAGFEAKLDALRRSYRHSHSSELLQRTDTCRTTLQSAVDMHKETLGVVQCDHLQHIIDTETIKFATALANRLQTMRSAE